MASPHNAQMVQNQAEHQTIHGGLHFHNENTTRQQQRSPTHPFRLGLHLTEAPIIEDDFFIGRSAELQEMEMVLQPEGTTQAHRRLVMGGMGGVGKTQLAVVYAKRHCHLYDSIFWLNAASEDVLKHSIRRMAQQVLDVEDSEASDDHQLVHVMRWLSDNRNTRWLLIFDNYDSPETYDIGRFCPHGGHGSAIITTRVPDEVQGRQLLVRPMGSLQQSLDIIATRSKRAHVDVDPHACYLARRMQGLPLALATVGAYLKHSPWTFQEYLETYERQFNVDNDRPLRLPDYQDRTLYTTWDVTYERLEADHPKAARLLRYLAFFDNQHLRHQMFRVSNDHSVVRKLAKTRSRLQALLRAPEKNDSLKWLLRISVEEFESIMHVLTEYCFVEARSGHGDYSIHSCVHDWALSSQTASTRSEGYWFAFDRVADAVDDIAPEYYAYAKYNTLTPHAVRLAHTSFSTISQDASDRRLYSMHTIAGFLRAQVQLEAAEQMYGRALAGKERALGFNHTSTLNTVHDLGRLYADQGKLDKAEQIYGRALAGYEKALGPNHTSTLDTVHNLGNLYADQGKLDEAEQMYHRALPGYEEALGPNHASTLNTINNIGLVYADRGKLDVAEQMHERALAWYEKVLGSNHILTLETVSNLGLLYKDQGKLDEAEQIYVRALAEFRKSFHEGHPWTLRTMLRFACLLIVQHKLREAAQVYQEIIAVYADRRVDATSRSQSTVVAYAVALSNSVNIFRDAFVDARRYLLRLVEHIRQYKHGHSNMIATIYLAKALLHLQDGESVQRVLLYYTSRRHGENLDLGRVGCNACHRRLNATMGIHVCQSCVDIKICDRCLSTERTNASIAAYCGHDQFYDFGTTIRQVLRSSSACEPPAAEVEAWMDALQQRYQSPVN